mgnify:CR=1 FL=1
MAEPTCRLDRFCQTGRTKRLKSLYEKGKTNDETEKCSDITFTATIWGVAFVAQSVGMDYVSPFTFNGVRSIIGGLVLIPVILV